ncbi:hypothetical protein J3R03_004619 [Actinoplanes couchii]|uniref:Uncharacterized protein n=1 Tax=Actinoplanes couchii TaxID=403638 RepID=A0ABQ3X7S1_9ACTN|nr:hypothetical protein [Actinoplanes couchii]GID54565.1 hypothetical protein Aco03nite_029690 [Actinoplanes couchii]
MNDRFSKTLPARAPSPPARRSAKPHRTTALYVLPGALTVSLLAGWLSVLAGSNLPTAALTGGGAFAGAAGLLLSVAHHAAEKRK